MKGKKEDTNKYGKCKIEESTVPIVFHLNILSGNEPCTSNLLWLKATDSKGTFYPLPSDTVNVASSSIAKGFASILSILGNLTASFLI